MIGGGKVDGGWWGGAFSTDSDLGTQIINSITVSEVSEAFAGGKRHSSCTPKRRTATKGYG